jgi:prefoldin subunit 5
MTSDSAIQRLMKDRDNMVHQITNREKEIAHLTKRLTDSLMPNQKALLQAQRARQVAMLDADQLALDNLKAALAHSTRK